VSTSAAAAPAFSGSRGLVASGLALATFMQVLDTTIANVSIPTIAGDLGVSTNEGTWVITSFAVANAISVPLTGWLMQRFGVVRTFIMSVVMFTLASFMCGMAWSLESLILFRVLQGGFSGPMIPGSQALLLSIFPPQKKATALTIWASTTLIAPICGPILGGYLSDNWSWPWIFWINVPVGLFCLYVCWTGLRQHETPTQRLPIDTVGLVLLVVWVGVLQIMLDTGKDNDWFASPIICIEAIIAVVGFIAFIIWELGEKHPIIDLSLFRNRNFTLGMFPYVLGYATFFGVLVLQPLWMQQWLGYNATWAGIVAAPSGIVAVLLSPIMGKVMQRGDARAYATVALVAFGIAFYLRSQLTADASVFAFIVPTFAQGVGMAIFFVAILNIMLDGIPPQRIPAASGLSNFMRITGGAFATSIATTTWERRAALHQSQLAEVSSVYDARAQQAIETLQSNGLSDQQTLALLNQNLNAQAYFLSAIDYFWICAWVTFAIIVFVWMTRRPRAANAPVAAE
jgi:DHA2 family multidrug resistance protein